MGKLDLCPEPGGKGALDQGDGARPCCRKLPAGREDEQRRHGQVPLPCKWRKHSSCTLPARAGPWACSIPVFLGHGGHGQGAEPRCAGDAVHICPHTRGLRVYTDALVWGLTPALVLCMAPVSLGRFPCLHLLSLLHLTRSSLTPRTRGTTAMSLPGSRRSSTGSRR